MQTKDELVQTVYKYAQIYDVKPQVMIDTIDCEDVSWKADQQSNITTKDGREESYGLAQINLPAHPEISYAQATTPEFAIEFMAKEMADGKASEWSCWRKLHNN